MIRKAPARATIRDVAQKANVSISTVSRYLNHTGYVETDTAKRIARAVEATNYTPSMVARSLRMQKSDVVLLVVPDICNPFYSGIAQTVQQLARKRGYVMALFDSSESEHESECIEIAQRMYASGILIASINMKMDVIHSLLQTHIPIVGMNSYQRCPFDSVHVDRPDGSYIATRHLLELGHKKIGFAGGTPQSTIGESRKDGYLQAMTEVGCFPSGHDVIEIGFSQKDGYEAGQYFARCTDRPTAICCANDQVALGLLAAMHACGIAVPERLSVTGMDDIPYASISNPGLTTVTNSSEDFASKATAMLIQRIDDAYTGPPRDIAISHRLVVRASTASPRL